MRISSIFFFALGMIITFGALTYDVEADEASAIQQPKLLFTSMQLENSKGVAVLANNVPAVVFTKSAGGYSPEQRAGIFTKKINEFVNGNYDPTTIYPQRMGKYVVVKSTDKEGQVFFTADKQTAKSYGISEYELACKWVNAIRKALGANEIIKDYSHLSNNNDLPASFMEKHMGKEQTGMASWYGGYFHGRTAADGSKYNKWEFTAAHKTLPFGSLVRVTNLKNDKSCVVKITDRGPFVKGRVIDLSKAAAQELDMLASGVAKIKLEIIGKY